MAIYKTMTFHKKRDGAGVALVRGNPIEDPELTEALAKERLDLALGWFKANIKEDGLLQYEYLPGVDEYSDDNNHDCDDQTMCVSMEYTKFAVGVSC